jgi:RNA polymerase sigma-70 factor (ECF subfamily)
VEDYSRHEMQQEEPQETVWPAPQVIAKAVDRLPEGYRVVFSLYLLEGYDHTEISQILGISESTSKTQYLRAKEKLKRILSDMRSDG